MRKNLAIFRDIEGVHISTHMSGKMRGVWSLSTSCKLNPICLERAKNPDSICAKCFAAKTIDHYSALAGRLKDNLKTLTTRVIPVENWPDVSDREIFRIESFGDLASVNQATNYLNFVDRNPGATFAWWTKNPAFLAEALKDRKKPRNLIVILSSVHVNAPDEPTYDFIDKVFTVYTPDYAKEHDIKINCGARSCDTCRRCYSKRTGRDVAELLK